ncbi:alanine or glycine:cation symporter, AGCS family [Ferrimonas sediminum]|uniref:Alanine or glycine:cation symporter, AGCS family n=1 Tax=Ferrimonas sediminum TaxID=718193 RepID=A0A1G8VH03_9GAMM|nr:AGCS family amino acid carrier protein [Ferrimonas sediminum]SDJ64595.1 alanine or glycine:cation symporter, AGCS family [Ferrimonas sediminum]
MQAINNFLLSLDGILGSAPWFPWVLLGVGLFFTLYLGFPQIRYFRRAWQIVAGKHDHKRAPGDTSHFQALSTALSGTVGTGNIGGVGLAIFLGGPAALFWMWMTAFLGMTTKFVEVTLSHKYREQTDDGTMAGGPMYFMDKALNMKWLGVIFALATIVSSFGTGNMPQVNNIAVSMEATFGIAPVMTGGVLSVLLALVILGGISRIAKVTSTLVPAMSVLYVLGALSVIFFNIDNLVPSFLSVFADAFTGSAATGGFLGATFAYAFNRGVNRGLFSNEAGQGSAPIAHASARADEPVSEGMVSILEPFIDTIIVCTLTGMVILSSGVWTEKHYNSFQTADIEYISGHYSDSSDVDKTELFHYLTGADSEVNAYNGVIVIRDGEAVNQDFTLIAARSVAEDVRYTVKGFPFSGNLEISQGKPLDLDVSIEGRSLIHSAELTTKAFTRGYFGDYGQYVVSIGLLLFAFSTAIAWSYYGDRAVTYLFGSRWILTYRVFYVTGFMVAAVADTTVVWNLAAVSIVLMTLPNLVGLLLLSKEMKQTVADYWRTSPDVKHGDAEAKSAND